MFKWDWAQVVYGFKWKWDKVRPNGNGLATRRESTMVGF